MSATQIEDYGALFLLLLPLIVAWTAFWVYMLVNAAKNDKWGWFIAMLIFGVLAIFYRLTAYETGQRQYERRRALQKGAGKLKREVEELKEKVRRLKKDGGVDDA